MGALSKPLGLIPFEHHHESCRVRQCVPCLNSYREFLLDGPEIENCEYSFRAVYFSSVLIFTRFLGIICQLPHPQPPVPPAEEHISNSLRTHQMSTAIHK